MKTSLWAVIALVTGIVGFLMGYSASGYTGTRARTELGRGGHGVAGAEHAVATAPASAGTQAGGSVRPPEKPAPATDPRAAPSKGAVKAREAVVAPEAAGY